MARFGYDRAAQDTGIVHFGIGAFHRAHQAWYTDRAMDAGDRHWMIAGVSLRSAGVAAQLNPQDGLYTVVERSAEGSIARVVGAVRDVIIAPLGRAGTAAALAAPTTHIVTLTITEKGYCRTADGALDVALANGDSVYSHLAEGIRARRAAGGGGLTLLSCDNLAGNGALLHQLLGQYLERHAPDLRAWFEAECRCPSSMVDRIVPATTQADRTNAAVLIGLDDHAAVMTEPFSQWVIEDHFAGPRPGWEAVGVRLVADVAPYETAKLRMLNGAHSALAYLGLERGHAYVHEAVADPVLAALIDRLMRDEAATSFAPAPGQDLAAYADALAARFANPALRHRLDQIAMDGSQKIPQRWLATLAAQRGRGKHCAALLAALGAWLRHVRGDRGTVVDPLAIPLSESWQAGNIAAAALALFGPNGLLGSAWNPNEIDIQMLTAV